MFLGCDIRWYLLYNKNINNLILRLHFYITILSLKFMEEKIEMLEGNKFF